jgi:hypothetical protein
MAPKRKLPQGIYVDRGVYCLLYYVNGVRHRERIGTNLRLAEQVLSMRRIAIAEGRFLDKKRPVTTTFDELANEYMRWLSPDESKGIPARKRSWKTLDVYAVKQLIRYFGDKRLVDITPALVSQYRDNRRSTISRLH